MDSRSSWRTCFSVVCLTIGCSWGFASPVDVHAGLDSDASSELAVARQAGFLASTNRDQSSVWDIAWTIADEQLGCEEGCQFWIEGAYQTLLIAVGADGTISKKPVLSAGKTPFEHLPNVEVPFQQGPRLVRAGDYFFGFWGLTNGQFAISAAHTHSEVFNENEDGHGVSVSLRASSATYADNNCPEQTHAKEQECRRLEDGSLYLLLIEHTINCKGSVVDIVMNELATPSNLGDMVHCATEE